MSDTPETDAALYPMNQVDIVWPEFARKLERERDEAQAIAKEAIAGLYTLGDYDLANRLTSKLEETK